ncbi:MAG: hypothetical protein CMH64_01765 [Nanoarchaeota archaeon]|nr:hypothetical protein [Nanoarchaeota archaeon]|tara:strand:+ start:1989 stop:2504 length:516 start_codon:yes stop_codon:yes gene_type:complete
MAILDSSRVTASAIQNQAFANIYNLINNRSNVPDPADSTGVRKFVYVRLPNIGRGNVGFPFVVVHRIKPSKSKNTLSVTKSFMSYDMTIAVYSQDSASDGIGNPNGAEQCNQITDNIQKTLNNATNRKALIMQGMAHLEYDIDTTEDDYNGRTVFISEFDIRFENTLLLTT